MIAFPKPADVRGHRNKTDRDALGCRSYQAKPDAAPCAYFKGLVPPASQA